MEAETLRWPGEGGEPNALTYIQDGRIGLVVNIPKNNEEEELSNDYLIRRAAIDSEVPLLTNLRLAERLVEALDLLDNPARRKQTKADLDQVIESLGKQEAAHGVAEMAIEIIERQRSSARHPVQ